MDIQRSAIRRALGCVMVLPGPRVTGNNFSETGKRLSENRETTFRESVNEFWKKIPKMKMKCTTY